MQRPVMPSLKETADSESPLQPAISAIWVYSRADADSTDSLQQYIDALEEMPVNCDLTIVVNGSIRGSDKILQLARDGPLATRVVQIHRACDESTAIRIGLDSSDGDLFVLLPSYVQSDPVAIVDMIAQVQAGAHYVSSWRYPRIDSRWGSLKSRLFNAVTSYMTGVRLHDVNSGLRLMKREVASRLPFYGDLHRFSPILAALLGFNVVEVRVRHLKERRVESGDSRIGVYLRRALDLLTLFFLFKFTKKPFRFFGLIGSTAFAMGTVAIVYLITERLMGVGMSDRPVLLLAIVSIVLGVQLFSVGLLGELIIFTHGQPLSHQFVEELSPPREKR